MADETLARIEKNLDSLKRARSAMTKVIAALDADVCQYKHAKAVARSIIVSYEVLLTEIIPERGNWRTTDVYDVAERHDGLACNAKDCGLLEQPRERVSTCEVYRFTTLDDTLGFWFELCEYCFDNDDTLDALIADFGEKNPEEKTKSYRLDPAVLKHVPAPPYVVEPTPESSLTQLAP